MPVVLRRSFPPNAGRDHFEVRNCKAVIAVKHQLKRRTLKLSPADPGFQMLVMPKSHSCFWHDPCKESGNTCNQISAGD